MDLRQPPPSTNSTAVASPPDLAPGLLSRTPSVPDHVSRPPPASDCRSPISSSRRPLKPKSRQVGIVPTSAAAASLPPEADLAPGLLIPTTRVPDHLPRPPPASKSGSRIPSSPPSPSSSYLDAASDLDVDVSLGHSTSTGPFGREDKMKRYQLVPGCRRLYKEVPQDKCCEKQKERHLSWCVKNGDYMLTPTRKNVAPFKLPDEIYQNKLRDYQREGVEWMWKLHCKSMGGILADDMGLGKTRQVSAFLLGLFYSNIIRRALIISPKTVSKGWAKELQDELNIAQAVKSYTKLDCYSKGNLQNVLKEGGILLTSYDMFRRHYDSFSASQAAVWDYVIFDEGHTIKNPDAKISQRAKEINCKHKIIVTGTPIQNNLKELHSLFLICCPSILGDKKDFNERFIKPIDKGQYKNISDQDRVRANNAEKGLHRVTSPYILRRRKDQKIDLPRKVELVIWLRLTDYQEKLYRALLTSTNFQNLVKEFPLATTKILQKICNHPVLLKSKSLSTKDDNLSEDVSAQLVDICPEDGLEITDQHSCKIHFVVSLMDDIIKIQKKRVLIFSQSRQMLHLIENALSLHFQGFEKFRIARIDGTTDLGERDAIVDDFQYNEKDPANVLLLTSKVGGFGITLTKASRVIIVDPAWNPSVDNQSVDRAYRIGTTEAVVTYRLLTAGTVEDKTYKMQVSKGSTSVISIDKKYHKRYFAKENNKFLSVPKRFDVPETLTEIEEIHGTQHELDDASLRDHMKFLKEIGVLAFTNHSKLFSVQSLPLPYLTEDDRQHLRSNKKSLTHGKATSDVVIGAEKYAFKPSDDIFKKSVKSIKGVVDRRLKIKSLNRELVMFEGQLRQLEEAGFSPHLYHKVAQNISDVQSQLDVLLSEEYPGASSSKNHPCGG